MKSFEIDLGLKNTFWNHEEFERVYCIFSFVIKVYFRKLRNKIFFYSLDKIENIIVQKS